MSLTILCVTKGEDYAKPFLDHFIQVAKDIDAQVLIALDGSPTGSSYAKGRIQWIGVNSKGYIESVLDDALKFVKTDFVFRIDDDEQFSPALVTWLKSGVYRCAEHWKFPRVHFWEDTEHFIQAPPLWPDHQTRLSTLEKSGGRQWIHAGSPFGGGELCPYPIEHYKFLVKTYEERKAIAERYDTTLPGSGSGLMTAFSLPEVFFSGRVPSIAYVDTNAVDKALAVANEIGMHQHPAEIHEFTSWLSTRKLHNVLEIGTLKGGTAALWHELAKGWVVSIDKPNGRFGGADHGLNDEAVAARNETLEGRFPRLRCLALDSHDAATPDIVKSTFGNESVDLLFIDGDHTYEGVKQDYFMYRELVRPGGIIAFHDVLDSKFHHDAGCFVDRFWKELPPHKAEIIAGNGQWGGIGVTFR